MGTLQLSPPGVANNWIIPQTLIWVRFAQGALLGNPGAYKVLLLAPKLAAGGSATADTTIYPIGDEQTLIDLVGAGSPAHQQWLGFVAVCPNAQIDLLAVTAGGGTAASDTVTFAVNATATGTATYTVCGKTFVVGFNTGDAFDTVIAEALKNAVNADTTLPVVVTRGTAGTSGVLTVTAKAAGTNGNWIQHHGSISASCGTTMAVAHTTLANGATNETHTAALATLVSHNYWMILPAINPTGTSDSRFAALLAQLQTQALPTTGFRQQTALCSADTLSNSGTLVTAYNKTQANILLLPSSEWEPMKVAAHWAAVRYSAECGSTPWASYDNYGSATDDIWLVPPANLASVNLSTNDCNSALNLGLIPIQSIGAGKTQVVMGITAAGADPRIRDVCKVSVCYRFADDLNVRWQTSWQRAKIADNDPVGMLPPSGADVCTPDRAKDLTIMPLIERYRENGWITNTEGPVGTKAATATGVDPLIKTRMNARIPLEVMPPCHQFAGLISEVSSG